MTFLFCAKCSGLFVNGNMSKQIDNQLISQNPGTSSKVNNKLVRPQYSKLKCQNIPIFRAITLWSTTPMETKQSANFG